jgi:DNA-binding protein HU-beta
MRQNILTKVNFEVNHWPNEKKEVPLWSDFQGQPLTGQCLTPEKGGLSVRQNHFFHFQYPLTNVTKAEVISEISQKTGIEKADVLTTVEAFFKVVKDSMTEGHNIYVRGFGSFVNKKRARKVARNISKNTSLIIDEHYIPSFKPSKTFVAKIKGSKKVVGEDAAPKAKAPKAKKAKS